jgi:internalin A
MMKKTLFALLALLPVLSLAACGAPAAQPTQAPASSAPAATEAPTLEPTPEPTPEPVVVFTDAALEAKVREAMGKPEGDITLVEAEAVVKLNLSNESFDDMNSQNGGIKDLSGLKHFTGLKELDISFNDIKDLTPLSGLTNLETLVFSGTGVTDLTPLKTITSMKCIVFCWTYSDHSTPSGVGNLDALANMKNLEDIDAKNAGISDISALAGLPKLWDVQLCDNQITDISPLAGLPLRILLLGNNPVEDFSPVKDVYPNLEGKDFEL